MQEEPHHPRHVTPQVGVWIEITSGGTIRLFKKVTPQVGVWIEISNVKLPAICEARHSSSRSVD